MVPTKDAFLFLTGLPARRSLPQLREALSTLTAGTIVRAVRGEKIGTLVTSSS